MSGHRHGEDVHYHLHIEGMDRFLDVLKSFLATTTREQHAAVQQVITLLQELKSMSNTISQQQDANTARIVADLATIATGIDGLKAQIAAGTGPAGSTITDAQEAALSAAADTADRLAAAFSTVGTGTTGTAVFDPSITVANGSLMADGVTVRNTAGADPANPMADFNPSLPVTA